MCLKYVSVCGYLSFWCFILDIVYSLFLLDVVLRYFVLEVLVFVSFYVGFCLKFFFIVS